MSAKNGNKKTCDITNCYDDDGKDISFYHKMFDAKFISNFNVKH
jgi:hypothetical protein